MDARLHAGRAAAARAPVQSRQNRALNRARPGWASQAAKRSYGTLHAVRAGETAQSATAALGETVAAEFGAESLQPLL